MVSAPNLRGHTAVHLKRHACKTAQLKSPARSARSDADPARTTGALQPSNKSIVGGEGIIKKTVESRWEIKERTHQQKQEAGTDTTVTQTVLVANIA